MTGRVHLSLRHLRRLWWGREEPKNFAFSILPLLVLDLRMSTYHLLTVYQIVTQ